MLIKRKAQAIDDAVGAAVLPHVQSEPWDRLWFSLTREPWTTLALVPAQRGGSTLAAVQALAAAGRAYQEDPIFVLDASRVAPTEVGTLLHAFEDRAGGGARMLVATSSPLERAAGIPIARGADAAVLLVRLGHASIADARATIDAIGPSHFIGAITAGT